MSREPVPEPARLEVLKSFTHPLRLRLYYALAARGSASATALAEDIGTKPQLAFYHLTRLRDLGVVEEDLTRETRGRERFWRQTSTGLRFETDSVEPGSDEAHTLEAVIRAQAATHFERLEAFLQDKKTDPLRSQAFSADALLHLAPEEMTEMRDEFTEVVTRWQRKSTERARDLPTHSPGRRYVMVFVHGFPTQP